MRKNVLIALAFCLATTFAFAQKIVNKDLQGHWSIAAFGASGIQYEMATGDVVVPAEMKSQMNAEAMAGMNEGLKMAAEQLKGGFVDFEGAFMKMGVSGSSETNAYTLTEKNGQQYITLKLQDGNTQDLPVLYKDKRLHVTVDPSQGFSMIFTKG